MSTKGNIYHRWGERTMQSLGDIFVYREDGWDVDRFIWIVTQVACETRDSIKSANAATLRAALKFMDSRAVVGEKTKRRQIESRLRRLKREARP